MKLRDSIKMAYNDLNNRKFRTLITAISISIGALLLMLTGSLGEGLQKYTINKFESTSDIKTILVLPQDKVKLEMYNGGNENNFLKKIDDATIKNIKNIKNVSSLVANIETNITGTKLNGISGSKVKILGIDLRYDMFLKSVISSVKNKKENTSKITDTIIAGSSINSSGSDEILVGEKYLKKLGITDYKSVIGKEIELNLVVQGLEPFLIKGKIKGVINGLYREGSAIVVPIEMAAKFQGNLTQTNNYLDTQGIQNVYVDTDKIVNVDNINKSINALGYSTFSQMLILKLVQNGMKILSGFLMSGGIIVLLVSSLGVINTMTMAVFEKTKSIGIMKAMGASKGNIQLTFLIQSALLGLLGSLIGIIVSEAISNSINLIGLKFLAKTYPSFDIDRLFVTPLWLTFFTIGITVLIAVIAGTIPAIRAANLDPVESLSYE